MTVINSFEFPLKKTLKRKVDTDMAKVALDVYKKVFEIIDTMPIEKTDLRFGIPALYHKRYPNMTLFELLGVNYIVDGFLQTLHNKEFKQFKFYYDQWLLLEEANSLLTQSIATYQNSRLSEDFSTIARQFYYEASVDEKYEQDLWRHAFDVYDRVYPILLEVFKTIKKSA